MKKKRKNNIFSMPRILVICAILIFSECFPFCGTLFAQNKILSSEEEKIMHREHKVLEEFQENQKDKRIQEHLAQGDLFFQQKDFEKASSFYNEALKLDSHDKKIIQKIEQTEKALFKNASERFDAHKQKALADVAAAWNPPPEKTSSSKEKIFVTESKNSNLPKILKKLETTRIPAIDFQDANLEDVIAFLAKKSREYDSEGKGVNFVVQLENLKKPITISFSLRDVSLMDVLDLIKKMTGIYCRVEEYAVLILPFSEQEDSLLVQSFDVRPDFFNKNIQNESDIRKQLENKGLPFLPGTTANYFPNTSKLVVRGTPEMLSLIANFITLEQTELPQVQIETRFVEFSEDKLEELRFRWQMGARAEIPALGPIVIPGRAGFAAKTGGLRGASTDALTSQQGLTANSLDEELGKGLPLPGIMDIGGILDGHGTRLLIDLMNRVAGGNLMAAPKITLQKGNRGTVRIAREFIYPRKYASPTIPDEDGLVIPPNPENFNFDDPKNIGVVLKVMVEEINPESRLIDLRLEDIQVVEFDGFINYGNSIVTINKDGDSSRLIEGIAYQPVFSVRRAQTSLQLRDGQTLVMGGFIRDDSQKVRDSVPVLGDIPLFGRLFQAKSDQSIKRNLIIMSTATLINSNEKNKQALASSQNP